MRKEHLNKILLALLTKTELAGSISSTARHSSFWHSVSNWWFSSFPLHRTPLFTPNNKLSCRRETMLGFVSLNILLSHSRSFEMTLLRKACVSPALLVFHWNYVCMLYHFQVIWRWIIMTLIRSLKIIQTGTIRKLEAVFYSPSIVTMAISLTIR